MAVRRWVVVIACVATLATASCGNDAEDAGGDGPVDGDSSVVVEVTAANFAFTPVLISVAPGSEVELSVTNDDDTQHSFTSEAIDVDLLVEGGEAGSTVFTAPDSGVAEFHCKFHPEMSGTIATDGSDAGASSPDDGTDQDLDY